MSFLWPEMLWLMLLVPVLIGIYLWLLRRKKKFALQYASLSLVKEAMGKQSRWLQHLPPILFLLGIAATLFAVSRPTAVVTLASQHETVILAMDVSGSMRATDVKPTRLVAAQNAAKAFIEGQPRTTRIGVVSFAGAAAMVQSPTLVREDILAAINGFQLQRGTAVGSGLLVSLKVLFPEVMFNLNSSDPAKVDTRSMPLRGMDEVKRPEWKPVAPGSYASAVIILLTDGQTTTGPDPLLSARMVADRGVRVFTVGVGTPSGEVIGSEGFSFRARLDEEALKNIANLTRGEYFHASTALDLKKIYEGIKSRLVVEKKETEVSSLFAALGALLALMAAGLSLLWFNRVL